MRHISTGVFFLALSISDLIYLFVSIYVLVVYGFRQADQSLVDVSCRIRHFTVYFTTNFSAWMLMMISCDRWIRTRFPMRSQKICTHRMALVVIVCCACIDFVLHVHLLTPLFGSIPVGITASCSANPYYDTYSYFFEEIWPIITTLTVTIIPSIVMLIFLFATIRNIRTPRKRVFPSDRTTSNPLGKTRLRFIHRQILILMIGTLTLFLVTTLPGALFRFVISSLKVKQPFSLSLLLSAVFGILSLSNHSFNFYLHCLTSKIFRREFNQLFSSRFLRRFHKNRVSITGKQHRLAPDHQRATKNIINRHLETGC